ncbi:MAG: rare lipoprotein [Myxococcales bacterium]|nr:rare lipoprotein [Myxococcales bacterium]
MKRPVVSPARAALLALVAVAGCATTRPSTSTSIVRDVSPGARGNVIGSFEGKASWYGKEQHGHLTANGERFDMYALTAAHRTLRMQTRVRVVNLKNGRDVVVRINDRGPYSRGRVIDVSFAAAKQLGMLEAGVIPVRVEVLGP